MEPGEAGTPLPIAIVRRPELVGAACGGAFPTFAFLAFSGNLPEMRQTHAVVVTGILVVALGCGDAVQDTSSTGEVAGVGETETCRVLCNACADGDEALGCDADCQRRIAGLSVGFDLDSCPEELAIVGECLGATGCVGQSCDSVFLLWLTCTGAVSP